MTAFRNLYLEELARIQERINRLFDQAMLASDYEEREGGLPGTWVPSVDVVETPGAFLLFAELPGVRREDLQLQVQQGRLELSGRRQPYPENPNFLRMERSHGPFRRVFELGAPVDEAGITAVFNQGVLRVEVPKRAGAAPPPVR
jgi:HSP20 family protein